MPPPIWPPVLATFTAVVCALLAAFLYRGSARLKFLIPASGLLLLGITLFGLIPEAARNMGWLQTLTLTFSGFFLLSVLDRFAFHFCPACTHNHDHGHCAKGLHGFGWPLVMAAIIHSFVDGWGMVAVQVGDSHFAPPVSFAILLHKIPEGLALGTMLRATTGASPMAVCLVLFAEMPTILGGVLGLWITPGAWVPYPLALAAGTFVFLGFHAIHGVYRTATS